MEGGLSGDGPLFLASYSDIKPAAIRKASRQFVALYTGVCAYGHGRVGTNKANLGDAVMID